MSLLAQTLTQYNANRFVFLFSIAAIGAVVLYFAYGAVDRMAISVRSVDATVLDKQHGPGGKAYNTVIAGGRPWIQSREMSEAYLVVLQVGGEKTGGLVSRELYESLNPGDAVRARQTLLVLEAMKMETPLSSPFDATVSAVHVVAGDRVAGGALLVELEG